MSFTLPQGQYSLPFPYLDPMDQFFSENYRVNPYQFYFYQNPKGKHQYELTHSLTYCFQGGADVSEFRPVVDISDTLAFLIFECELPGFHKDEVNVEINNDILYIYGNAYQKTIS